MLILPLHRKPNRQHFPLITAALVVINVLVFFLLQGDDARIERQASAQYSASGALALEWQWFSDWLDYRSDVGVDPQQVDRLFGPPGEAPQGDQVRVALMENQPEFHHALNEGALVDTSSKAFVRWQQAHQALTTARQASFTQQNLLRYDTLLSPATLTHMFMHGGVGHLIGNLLFLVALGLLVEGALGHGRFLLAYLLSGVGAALLSLAVRWGDAGGGLGASGAIAGLMGLFAVIYGMRRVRFFYWVLVYFDYVRAPALVLLPAWLGWEVLAYAGEFGANVAYEAHIGGLLTGAVLGLLASRTGQVDDTWMDGGDALEEDRGKVQRAEQALRALDGPQAKNLLRPLLTRYPEESTLWRKYLAACRLQRDDPEWPRALRRLFQQSPASPEMRALIRDSFDDYRQMTGGKPAINAALAAGLARRLASWQYNEQAAWLVSRLARRHPKTEGLLEASRALAANLRTSDPEQAARFARLASHLRRRGAVREPAGRA